MEYLREAQKELSIYSYTSSLAINFGGDSSRKSFENNYDRSGHGDAVTIGDILLVSGSNYNITFGSSNNSYANYSQGEVNGVIIIKNKRS